MSTTMEPVNEETNQEPHASDVDVSGSRGEVHPTDMLDDSEARFPKGSELEALERRMLPPGGRFDMEAAREVEAEIVARFLASPEACTHEDAPLRGEHVRRFLQLARLYQQRLLTRLGVMDVVAVLLDDFPSSTEVEPEDAPEIIVELRTFFQFASRELALPAAENCARVLDAGLALALMHTLQSARAWTEEMENGPTLPEVISAMRSNAERNKKKAQRKAQKASRRKNR